MGCGGSTEAGADPKKQIRILLLGTASCGKSTFAKQMKVLFGGGFTGDEQGFFREILTSNLFLGLKDLIQTADDVGKKFEKSNKKSVAFFRDFENPYAAQMTPDVIEKATALWTDDAIKEVLADDSTRKGEFGGSLLYIMEHMDRISKPDWVPSTEDILHVRARTSGMVETRFTMQKFLWTLVDVGGQRVERRKWIHSQQGLNGVLYFAALDDYDVPSDESEDQTRMKDSLDVWSETLSGEALANVPVILFLNKKDLFEEKIKRVPIKNTYKKFKGGDDFEKSVDFVRSMFMQKLDEPTSKVRADNVYVHVTCALDQEQMRVVFSAIKDFIFQQRLKNAGLVLQ